MSTPSPFKHLPNGVRTGQIMYKDAQGVAPTCVAHYAKDKSTRLVRDKAYPLDVRPYSVREYARLQGVPDWFAFPVSNSAAYRQIGNGVSVPVGRWIGGELKRYFNAQRSLT